jgi:lysophospholipase L1-like esterase
LGVHAAQADILMVVGKVPVTSADAAAIGRLQAFGQAVVVVKDSASTTADAGGKSLVVISESVGSGNVGDKFNSVAVPVLVYEPWVYDNLGMTGVVESTDFGQATGQSQLQMAGTHALTGGLTGTVTVGSAAATFSWGMPGAAAVVAATLAGDASRAAIFGYEAGVQLANGQAAPARRVALHPNVGAIDGWNANGQALFDAAVAWAANLQLPPPPPPPGDLRIMPLGDSITQGRDGHWSYRRDLAMALTNAGCSYDFVGTSNGPSTGPGSGDFDRDHEGHSGYRTGQILNKLPGYLQGITPDWVLLHIGTNDVLQALSVTKARNKIGKIIDTLRADNPNVGILLAQIIPNRPANEAQVVALNDLIAALAAQKNKPASPVILVDHYSGFDTFSHNYDQVHPNDAGEALMAARWLDALLPRIAASCQN